MPISLRFRHFMFIFVEIIKQLEIMTTDLKPNRDKMLTLKLMVLMQFLKEKEVKRLYGCDYEFDIEGDNITRLHVWFNSKGSHNYEERYHKSFKMKNISVKCILD
jgi:hypothetical protein